MRRQPIYRPHALLLPKDLRAVNYRAKMDDIELPVLNAILPSNEQQILHLFRRIMKLEKKRVGFLGFSFKAGTDDLRESPIVSLIEYLLGKGFQVKIFDRNVNLSRLIGANKEFLEKRIPHISTLMTQDPQEVIRDSEILIISHASEEFSDVIKKIKHSVTIIDLARALGEDLPDQIQYEGISW